MISYEEIKKHYSQKENLLPGAILKEYLQLKMLDIIFSSKYSHKMVFMGGTCIRIVFGNDRFSEDLDLDNLGLKMTEFEDLINIIQRELLSEGVETEIRNVSKGVYRCYLKFPKILFNNRLSNLEDEKILIQIGFVA